LDLLKQNGIEILVDVRRFPLSRKNPQFNREDFSVFLQNNGIQYFWMGEKLGGFRKGGYLSYMASRNFEEGIEDFLKLAHLRTTAVMCAEKLWFRCHRRFIASYLVNKNYPVVHIIDKKRNVQHLHTPKSTTYSRSGEENHQKKLSSENK
ncbi:MAG: DUF488 domain-containing protein, partial [bacterium JZ-2024 1]